MLLQKNYYQPGTWKKIETDSNYDLGERGYQALKKFLPVIKDIAFENILHLGIGRAKTEINYLLKYFPKIKTYLLNDICPSVIDEVMEYTKKQFPKTNFLKEASDIEKKSAIKQLRKKLTGPTLIALLNNTAIFSNSLMDKYLLQTMKKNDYFLFTGEMYHRDMFKSYQTKAVLDWLSNSIPGIETDEINFIYDDNDLCLKILCRNKTLFTSYKPKTIEQLRERMTTSGFEEIALRYYKNLHFYCVLYQVKK